MDLFLKELTSSVVLQQGLSPQQGLFPQQTTYNIQQPMNSKIPQLSLSYPAESVFPRNSLPCPAECVLPKLSSSSPTESTLSSLSLPFRLLQIIVPQPLIPSKVVNKTFNISQRCYEAWTRPDIRIIFKLL